MPYDNPYSGQSPILGPMARALQMHAMIQQLKNDALDRQFRQEQAQYQQQQDATSNQLRERAFTAQEQERGYDRKQDALKTTLGLNQIGAKRGNPALESSLDAALGKVKDPRMAATTPGGETYYLPTEGEARNKSLQDILSKGRIETAVDLERMHGLFPYKVAEKEAQQRYEQQYATPKDPHFVQTDAAGMGIDPKTGATLWSNPALAKPKAAGAAHPAKASIEKIEGIKANAQQALKEAQYWQTQAKDNPKAQNNYYMALAKAKAAEDEAIALAGSLQKLYPKNFSFQVDKDNNLAVDWKD